MAILTTPENLQKMEFDVTTAEGPSRVTIVTGMVGIGLSARGPNEDERKSYKVLLDPTLTPGQFRKATATVSVASLAESHGGQSHLEWSTEDAQATFDDEAGQVQLIIDGRVTASGDINAGVGVRKINFQVTTLARV